MGDYHSSFLYKAKQTVYKWWCVVYKPTYKLFHNGYWPAEKEPYYQPPITDVTSSEITTDAAPISQATTDTSPSTDTQASSNTPKAPDSTSDNNNLSHPDNSRLAKEMAQKIMATKQGNIDNIVSNTDILEQPATAEPELDLSTVDSSALDKANEIMARLAREAAEDEAKKQAEIDAAKSKAAEDAKKAAEDARLASILQSTKVDISAYIEEGKAQSTTPKPSEPELDLSTVDQSALDKANEIMARLAREAAEDEAKKQAEIDAAKSKAAEDAKKASDEARLASILQSTKVDISSYIQEGMANRNDE